MQGQARQQLCQVHLEGQALVHARNSQQPLPLNQFTHGYGIQLMEALHTLEHVQDLYIQDQWSSRLHLLAGRIETLHCIGRQQNRLTTFLVLKYLRIEKFFAQVRTFSFSLRASSCRRARFYSKGIAS